MGGLSKIKVGINGYGVIGKRIADAVRLQDDMELVGITARRMDFRLLSALRRGFSVYAVDGECSKRLADGGVEVRGEIDDLLAKVDVVVDATPAGVGKENKKKYDTFGVKSIFEGGEKHELTDLSFVAEVNYKKAVGKKSVRVVSCNTTAVCRVLNPFMVNGLLEKAYVVIARRGADPVDSHKSGPLGTVVIEKNIPSHQGFDARTVIPELPILTAAYAVPATLGHLHTAVLRLTERIEKEEVVKILKTSSRVVGIGQELDIFAQNQLVEMMRDIGRPRADMWEVAFWEDSLYVDGRDVCFYYQVHNEAIVVPENIDAIRALTGLESSADRSIDKTNASLGVKK